MIGMIWFKFASAHDQSSTEQIQEVLSFHINLYHMTSLVSSVIFMNNFLLYGLLFIGKISVRYKPKLHL